MHVTLHITTGCNMNCSYCYSPPEKRIDMPPETACRAVDFAAAQSSGATGVIFFGGEPLLLKDLIADTIEYCGDVRKKVGRPFHFKLSTNGRLLDEEFLDFAELVGLSVAMSFDGLQICHDAHRVTKDGSGTFVELEPKLDMLLRRQPYTSILMTVNPDNVKSYHDSVKFLFEKGVKYLVVSLNYAALWTDDAVRELKRQYRRIAQLYERMTLRQEKFYFSPFEVKLATHIKGEDAKCFRCHLGQHQLSVAPDGAVYPCVQFVKDGVSNKDFSIGDVFNGIDDSRLNKLYNLSKKRASVCAECSLDGRCNNDCSCLNWQTTGAVNGLSPVLCETERAIFPIADSLGERLFLKKAPMFIQKHYNAVYPILSLFDDMS